MNLSRPSVVCRHMRLMNQRRPKLSRPLEAAHNKAENRHPRSLLTLIGYSEVHHDFPHLQRKCMCVVNKNGRPNYTSHRSFQPKHPPSESLLLSVKKIVSFLGAILRHPSNTFFPQGIKSNRNINILCYSVELFHM